MASVSNESPTVTAEEPDKVDAGASPAQQAARRGFLKGAASALASLGIATAGLKAQSVVDSGSVGSAVSDPEAGQSAALPTTSLTPSLGTAAASSDPPPTTGNPHANVGPYTRAITSFEIRIQAATNELLVPIPAHPNNGDEARYTTKIGNFTKGLPHNQYGEVDLGAYATFKNAINTGTPAAFEAIELGGNLPFVDPQSGLAYDLEGTDSHQLYIPPAYPVASQIRADEMVELYWVALARDVPFDQYGLEPITQAAIAELNRLPYYGATKPVTAQNLFRDTTPGSTVGPYTSQFFLMPVMYGALTLPLDANGQPAQLYNVYKPGIDYNTDPTSFLAVQNGQGTTPQTPNFGFGPNQIEGPRYLHTGRDMAAFVHVCETYQAFLWSATYLLDLMQIPYNAGNPYVTSRTQEGWGTFGGPAADVLVAEVASRALKAVWFQKFFVHRTERPEEYGGLVNFKLNAGRPYPLNSDVLNSVALKTIGAKYNNNYFLPQAFPEGSPYHPALGSGHAVISGACATFIKAYFKEDFVIPNPVMPSPDGTRLMAYNGPDAGLITVQSEANKLAANVGIGRLHAGVHWRSDHYQSLLLGEKVAISILRDQRALYNENFNGYTFTKFDGTTITA